MTPQVGSWLRLGPLAGGGPVLAVDFDGTVRQEATFRDLAANLPDLDLWHAVAPDGDGLTARDYLDRWLDVPDDGGRPVRAVFGYCAGSVFASALADGIEARAGTRPPVVLFNPGLPDATTLHRDVRGVVSTMTGLDERERSELRDRADRIRAESADDLASSSADYVALYQQACATTLRRLDIDPDIAAELAGLFRAYTTYLTAARQVVRGSRWSSGVSLTARGHHGTAFTEHEIAVDLPRGELLRSHDVAATIRNLLAVRT